MTSELRLSGQSSAPALVPLGGMPLFFGAADHPLFGVHHSPSGRGGRGEGIVLCYPGPHEYRQVHFVFRQLARSLAGDGFHVMRFDYSGTGDSSGAMSSRDLETWARDIAVAADELRDRAGVRRISLVGMRLGASLALLAAGSVSASQLVLWDPVVSGAEYLEKLEALQRRTLRDLHYPVSNAPARDELLGHVVTPVMRRALTGLDLRAVSLPKARRVTVVCAEERPEYAALQASIAASGVAAELTHVPDETLARVDRVLDTFLVSRIPASIRTILGTRAS